MDIYQGVQAVATHCGVRPDDVYHWMRKHGPEGTGLMPAPAVAVDRPPASSGRKQTRTYGWATAQLDDILAWAREYYPDRVPPENSDAIWNRSREFG